MKEEEIKQAAKEYTESDIIVRIGKPERSVIALGVHLAFLAGADHVNERQPYSKEDIQLAMKFAYNKGIGINLPLLSPDELLKLWEETK